MKTERWLFCQVCFFVSSLSVAGIIPGFYSLSINMIFTICGELKSISDYAGITLRKTRKYFKWLLICIVFYKKYAYIYTIQTDRSRIIKVSIYSFADLQKMLPSHWSHFIVSLFCKFEPSTKVHWPAFGRAGWWLHQLHRSYAQP